MIAIAKIFYKIYLNDQFLTSCVYSVMRKPKKNLQPDFSFVNLLGS